MESSAITSIKSALTFVELPPKTKILSARIFYADKRNMATAFALVNSISNRDGYFWSLRMPLEVKVEQGEELINPKKEVEKWVGKTSLFEMLKSSPNYPLKFFKKTNLGPRIIFIPNDVPNHWKTAKLPNEIYEFSEVL